GAGADRGECADDRLARRIAHDLFRALIAEALLRVFQFLGCQAEDGTVPPYVDFIGAFLEKPVDRYYQDPDIRGPLPCDDLLAAVRPFRDDLRLPSRGYRDHAIPRYIAAEVAQVVEQALHQHRLLMRIVAVRLVHHEHQRLL